MSAQTSIQWTDRSWNPVRGCSLVSDGCRFCYAMKQAHRFSGVGQPYDGLTELGPAGPRWTGKIRTVDETLVEPLRWRKPQRIFVNSMSDLFHEGAPAAFIDRVFAVMATCPQHTFQILTKRPERMQRYVTALGDEIALGMGNGQGAPRWDVARRWVYGQVRDTRKEFVGVRLAYPPWPLPNVWLGVSCENQQTADERIPQLLQTSAAVRFVSAEPLLGPVDFEAVPLPAPGAEFYGLKGVAQPTSEKDTEPDDWKYWTRRSAKLDWVIVGGESGPGARRSSVRWVRSIVRQCQQADAPVFVKQLGAVVIDRNDAGFLGEEPDHWPDIIDQEDRIEHDLDGTRDGYQGAPVRIHLKDRKGGDMSEWPADLRVRQFPATQREVVTS